jgi:hypothetical protein
MQGRAADRFTRAVTRIWSTGRARGRQRAWAAGHWGSDGSLRVSEGALSGRRQRNMRQNRKGGCFPRPEDRGGGRGGRHGHDSGNTRKVTATIIAKFKSLFFERAFWESAFYRPRIPLNSTRPDSPADAKPTSALSREASLWLYATTDGPSQYLVLLIAPASLI